jgi:hypothetical protein
VTVTDDDGGSATASEDLIVRNVPPTFSGAPSVSLDFDEAGGLTSIQVQQSFHDPGANDSHRVNILQGSPGSAQVIDLPVGDRSFTIHPQFAPAPALDDVFPLLVNVQDDDSPNSHLSVSPAEFTINYGESLTGDLSSYVTDPDGGTLLFSALTSPEEGYFYVDSNGAFAFASNPDFFGGTTVLLPVLVMNANGPARFGIFTVGVNITAPLVGHEMASASFWISSTGIGNAADTSVTRVPLGGPVPFSPLTPNLPNQTNGSQVAWLNPVMPISTDTDQILAYASAGSTVGGAIATSDNFLPIGSTQMVPQASSAFNTSLTAGIPTGFTYSAAQYTVNAGPAGPNAIVPINMILHVNAGATDVTPVNRVQNVPHWVYAEITTGADGGAAPPGTGTYIVGRFDGGAWTWAQQIDTPNNVDVFFVGTGLPFSAGFDLNLTITTSAGVLTGGNVVIYTAVGWDAALPGALVPLFAPQGNGLFPGLPAPPP